MPYQNIISPQRHVTSPSFNWRHSTLAKSLNLKHHGLGPSSGGFQSMTSGDDLMTSGDDLMTSGDDLNLFST